MSSTSSIVSTQDFTANHVQVDDLAEQFSNIGLQSKEQNVVYQKQPSFSYGTANYEDDRWSSLQETTPQLILALLDEPDLFIVHALDERLTYAVQQLIKQAKNMTTLAQELTNTLSTRFYEVMTHRIGKHVVKQCLASLDSVHNEVLFERAIQYFLDLAIHPEGCISLNECITYMTGPLRMTLLLLIAEKSAYLSRDPHGNFVVQHVLSLNNEYVNAILCNNLRGQYVQLALMERSSHVVEKCISCSIHGMHLVVKELLKKDRLLCQVTSNQYGNYVVQTALRATRVCDTYLYRCLVQKLVKNFVFHRNRYAEKVVHMLRISGDWQSQG